MAEVEYRKVAKSYGATKRDRGHLVHDSRRPLRRAAGAVGMRQDHAPADDRGPRIDHQGRGADRRRGDEPGPSPRPRHRDGVPVLRALPADDGARQHRLRPRSPQGAQGADRRACRVGGPDARHHLVSRPQARGSVGRPAPARRDGPRHCPRAQGVPVRRAALEPRRQAARPDALRDPPSCTTGSARRRSTSLTIRSRR